MIVSREMMENKFLSESQQFFVSRESDYKIIGYGKKYI